MVSAQVVATVVASGLVGGVAGMVTMAMCVAGKVNAGDQMVAKYKKLADDWHKLWEKVNNQRIAYRDEAKTLKVCVNGKGGRREWKTAHEVIVGKLKEDHNG